MKHYYEKVSLFFKQHHYLWLVIIALPVVIVYGSALLHPNGIGEGDVDFFYAMSEAARKIMFEYHQFPWWNPWIGGGIPLFADPQFGLFSIHTLIITIVGTVVGWKISLLVYVLIGLYGLRKLFVDVLKTPEITATLLSLTWALSWLWILRGAMGHYTFFVMCFLPWLLVFYFNRTKTPRAWLYLGLTTALLLNTSIHYLTVMSVLFFSIIVVADLIYIFIKTKAKNKLGTFYKKTFKPALLFFIKAALVALPLSALKIYASLSLSKEYQRSGENPPELFSGYKELFNALFGLRPADGHLLPSNYSSQEASVGIGIGIFILVVAIISVTIFRYTKTKKFQVPSQVTSSVIFFALLCAVFLLLSFGDFTSWAPFTYLRELPFFDQTRVAVRWLIFVGFTALFIIAAFKTRNKKLRIGINSVLALNLLLIGVVGAQILSSPPRFIDETDTSQHTGVPIQRSLWQAPRPGASSYDENLFNATQDNISQITTSLIPYYDTRNKPNALCDETKNSCKFITTQNATVTSWSPNKIVLKRTAPGDIQINMSPGKHWNVNKTYPFAHLKSTNQAVPFIITSKDSVITIQYAPKGSLSWLELR